ncbi:MAG: histidinol dehydrogenase [Deltaproteobacteria bacterium]|nr:histidinol dehydrogenase [Deltaproteobacteria bacterium]
MTTVPILEIPSPQANELLARIAERGWRDLAACEVEVRGIIEAVRARGDEALRELTGKFEGRVLTTIEVARPALDRAVERVAPDVRQAIHRTVERVRSYHRRQLEPSWTYREEGMLLGQLVRPVRRVGVYAPGGTARYPSSVIMNVVPARVAGVEEVLLATPSPGPEVLHAARASGVDRVFDLGGAQAIAALAVGTETVPQVDLVVGPGNRWVTAAKRAVYGEVGIDMLAGPSEILIVADAGSSPEVLAADMIAQAEHDELSTAILVTDNGALARRTAAAIDEQVETLPRATIARKALESRGAIFVARSLDEAAAIADHLAPEHLVLSVAQPDPLLRRIRAAGAVFVGYGTPQVVGDYVAGPSHTLPTGGGARFASPLGVHTFLVRSSLVRYDAEALRRDAPAMRAFASVEGLEGHWRSVERHLSSSGKSGQ